jgi:hypothetical protein
MLGGGVPAIADVDGDGRNELAVTGTYWPGYAGWLDKVWLFDLQGSGPYGRIEWGQLGGGPQHQSRYPVPALPCRATPTPTATGSPVTRTPTPTRTPSPSRTATLTPSPTLSRTATPSATPIPGCEAGTWQQAAPLPSPIREAAVVAHAGLLYSFGGNSNYTLVPHAYRYDPALNTWSPRAPLPAARFAASAVSDGTYIYILNGGTLNAVHNTFYRYDPASDSYTMLAPAPTASVHQAAVLRGDRIYRIAGCSAPVVPCPGLSSVDVYQISTNTWLPAGTIAPYPQPLGWLMAVTDGGYIYTAGGSAQGVPDSRKTYRYDPAGNLWDDAAITDLADPRAAAAGAILHGRWILAGGFSFGGETNTVTALALGTPGGSWIPLPLLPLRRGYPAGARAGAYFYAVGGMGGQSFSTQDVQVYSDVPCATPTATAPATATLVPAPPSPSPTAAPATPTTPRLSPTATCTRSATPPRTPGGPTDTPTATATPCAIAYTDVPATNPFYAFIRCLACRQIVSGYSDGTFRWGADVTRGQLAKILANAAGLTTAIPSIQQTFSDVPAANAFWLFVERLAGTGAISGYACGGVGEPCDPLGRPYFRWGANATRGQISKITAVAAHFGEPVPTTQQTFADVPPTNVFWAFIERLAARQIISGYACGGPGEPCDPPQRPYFRWGAPATRGQTAKIAANTFYPGCQTPARR